MFDRCDQTSCVTNFSCFTTILAYAALKTHQVEATNNLALVPLLIKISTLRLHSFPETENEDQGTKVQDSTGDSGQFTGSTTRAVKGELLRMLLVLAPLELLPDFI